MLVKSHQHLSFLYAKSLKKNQFHFVVIGKFKFKLWSVLDNIHLSHTKICVGGFCVMLKSVKEKWSVLPIFWTGLSQKPDPSTRAVQQWKRRNMKLWVFFYPHGACTEYIICVYVHWITHMHTLHVVKSGLLPALMHFTIINFRLIRHTERRDCSLGSIYAVCAERLCIDVPLLYIQTSNGGEAGLGSANPH